LRQSERLARAAIALAVLATGMTSVTGMGGEAMASGDGVIALPEPARDGALPVERAIAERRSRRAFAPEPLSLAAVSQLLWAAQGVTDPEGRRTAPSAGALYPLEVYLVAGAVSGLQAGVYRYDPRRHRLLLHSEGDARPALVHAALRQEWLGEAPAIVLLAAVYERSARKYGERAARYVHMEVGHAAQNVYLQAQALGLGTTMVGAFRDGELARVAGLPGEVKPLGLLPVGRPR
jgi:SagB-type dehydrogenase family enzyme